MRKMIIVIGLVMMLCGFQYQISALKLGSNESFPVVTISFDTGHKIEVEEII